MLHALRLQNFRGFKDHTVEFPQFCILMGQNNAGKTTIIEALRIVALAQAKAGDGANDVAEIAASEPGLFGDDAGVQAAE